MSAQAEMQAVIIHAADKLQAVQQKNSSSHTYNNGYSLPGDALMAMSYAEAIFRLLATYLKLDTASQNGKAKPTGRPADAPRDEHGRYRPTPRA